MGFDQVEPFPFEEFAVVGDLPVAVQQAFPFGVGELSQRLDVGALVEVGVVAERGGEVGGAGSAGVGVDEPCFDPAVAGVAGGPYPDGDVWEAGAVGCAAAVAPGTGLAQDAEQACVVVLLEGREFVEAEERVACAGVAANVVCVCEVAAPSNVPRMRFVRPLLRLSIN